MSSARKTNGSMTLALPPANSVRSARAKALRRADGSPLKHSVKKVNHGADSDAPVSIGSETASSPLGAGQKRHADSHKDSPLKREAPSKIRRISAKSGGLVAEPSVSLERSAETSHQQRNQKPEYSGGLFTSTFFADLKEANVQALIDDIRQNFDRLNTLRMTEPEALLSKYRENVDERIAASDRLVENMRRERDDALARLDKVLAEAPRSPPKRRVSLAYSDFSSSSRKFFECKGTPRVQPFLKRNPGGSSNRQR